MNFKVKLLFTLFLGVVISTIIAGSVLAGTSISGSSQVYPGRTYTYTIKVTENATSIDGEAVASGILGNKTKNFHKDSSSGLNENITATATITVTIPSSAAVGSTGKITVSGQAQKVDSDTHATTLVNISGSKTITIIAPADPDPTAWELAIKDIKKVEEGTSITFEMNPDDSKEINVPIEVFEAIKEGKVILTIDYGLFACTIDGNLIGEIPADIADVNVGMTLHETQQGSDMLAFSLNYQSAFFYIAEYTLEPYVSSEENLVYVYREYKNINLLEYVNVASLDSGGNVTIKAFTPGYYLVSAVSIPGSEGNMDEDKFIELFATSTPEPTAVPTLTPEPTVVAQAPTAEPEEEDVTKIGLTIWTIGTVALVVILVFVVMLVIAIKNQNKRHIE